LSRLKKEKLSDFIFAGQRAQPKSCVHFKATQNEAIEPLIHF